MRGFTRTLAFQATSLILISAGCSMSAEQHAPMAASSVASRGHASSAEDTNSVRRALDDYLEGFRNGSLASLHRAFAAESIMVQKNTARAEAITITPTARLLPSWAAKPDPSARLEDVRIYFTGRVLAVATFNLHYAGTVYNDQLNFYRYGEQWKIATKLTAVARSGAN
jgi:hypothetical protein